MWDISIEWWVLYGAILLFLILSILAVWWFIQDPLVNGFNNIGRVLVDLGELGGKNTDRVIERLDRIIELMEGRLPESKSGAK